MIVAISIFLFSTILLLGGVRFWYFRQIARHQRRVRHKDGRTVAMPTPRMITGNLLDIYRSDDKLETYHALHKKLGHFILIHWLWLPQLSIASYDMARKLMLKDEQVIEKFPQRPLIRRLYGDSILISTGSQWKRQRWLLQPVFGKRHVECKRHREIFVEKAALLASRWDEQLLHAESIEVDVFQHMTALTIGILGLTLLSHDFRAVDGKMDEFLEAIAYVLEKSLNPLYMYIRWWSRLPTSSNRRLEECYQVIDDFLYGLIRQRRDNYRCGHKPNTEDLLDRLLAPASGEPGSEDEESCLSEKEVRDNLLAFILNGHKTTASTLSYALYLLSRAPKKMVKAQAEIDQCLQECSGRPEVLDFSRLAYLEGAILESMRLLPPFAGWSRITVKDFELDGWSIPSEHAIGATLTLIHRDPTRWPEPDQFRPQRYCPWGAKQASVTNTRASVSSEAPPSTGENQADSVDADRSQSRAARPMSFGVGPRKCLGEHFAMAELRVVLSLLLNRYDFQMVPGHTLQLEQDQVGLFIATSPEGGLPLIVTPRKNRTRRAGADEERRLNNHTH